MSTLELVGSFLIDRKMLVKIGSTTSIPRKVNCSSSPQGSVLGNYLFCISTDKLTEPEPRLQSMRYFSPNIGLARIVTEGLLDTVQKGAAVVGMKVNPLKTQLLCISASADNSSETFIQPSSGELKIRSTSELKILGFRFGC